MSQKTAVVLAPGTAVEVRCHADCPWIGNFVIAEVVGQHRAPAYRVQRAGAAARCPTVLVPASDVRPAR